MGQEKKEALNIYLTLAWILALPYARI